ncbi:MAG: hypothetical protein R3B54_01380 [Bdellovibrionota bacterium]
MQSPPDWFLPKLTVREGATLVILDDDVAIHLVWQQRLSKFTRTHRLNVLHFSLDKELFDWCGKNNIDASVTFLVDYELIGSGNTGVEVIKRLGIEKNSVLVTSHYEDKRIRAAAKEMGTPFIPKMMAAFIPLEAEAAAPKRADLPCATLLLDDEELVHLTWKAAAKSEGKPLATFKNPEALFEVLEDWSPESDIYIDRNLGGGVLGEEVAKALYDKGYRNLYLATGLEADSLPSLPWIKGIRGKTPPWVVSSELH